MKRDPAKPGAVKSGAVPQWWREALALREQGLTLAQIGERFGVGRERVRQVIFLVRRRGNSEGRNRREP